MDNPLRRIIIVPKLASEIPIIASGGSFHKILHQCALQYTLRILGVLGTRTPNPPGQFLPSLLNVYTKTAPCYAEWLVYLKDDRLYLLPPNQQIWVLLW
jgi:hypothetical protein